MNIGIIPGYGSRASAEYIDLLVSLARCSNACVTVHLGAGYIQHLVSGAAQQDLIMHMHNTACLAKGDARPPNSTQQPLQGMPAINPCGEVGEVSHTQKVGT